MLSSYTSYRTLVTIGCILVFLGKAQAEHSECSYHMDQANNDDIMSPIKSSTPVETDVAYNVEFINMWSKSNHPPLYPDDAHWSPPVIVSHNKNYQMWAEDELASKGIERVAERGSTSKLRDEFEKAGDNIRDYEIGVTQFNSQRQSQTIKDIDVDKKHPYISAISMIAPSPDWFSGFYDVVPVSCDGYWLESFTILTQPYDSGTDSGRRYTSRNSDTNPEEPIFELSPATVPSTNVFVNEDIGDVLPVVEFKFTLVKKPRNMRG